MENNTKGILIALAVAVGLGVGAGLYLHNAKRAAPVEPLVNPAPLPDQGAGQPPAELDGSDAVVREKARALSNHPAFAQWLQIENIIRRLTAGIAIVADGNSPRDSLEFLGPKKKFLAKRRGKRVTIDPRSYARYDALGDAVESVNAQEAAKFLQQFGSQFQAAYAELGSGKGDFRAALLRSIQELLHAPIVDGDILLREKVASFAMADPKLESLSAAQKHLLRMGPKNTARIQEKLRQTARAMGVPEDQLPPSETYHPIARAP